MELIDHLMAMENRLATGSAVEYREILARDALVIVPGAVLDKESCVAAMDESPGWDRVELSEPRSVVRDQVVTIVYEFNGWRKDVHYRAVLSSTYALEGSGWHLVLHQQTPAS